MRLSPALHAELRGWAAQEFRSLNAHIEYLLQDALRRRRAAQGRPLDSETDPTASDD